MRSGAAAGAELEPSLGEVIEHGHAFGVADPGGSPAGSG